MNYIDPIILVILAWSVYRGLSRGLIIMVATFIALIAGIWGAAHFSGLVADWMVNTLYVKSPYIHLVAFTITFLGIVILINIAAYMVSNLLDAIAFGFLNRLLGGVFGLLKGALLLSVFLIVLNTFDKRHDFMPKQQMEDSLLYYPVANLASNIFPFLRFNEMAEEIEKIFN